MSADPAGAGASNASVIAPASYFVTVTLVVSGAGSAEIVAPVTAAPVSKSAARRTSKRGSSTVLSTCSSGNFAITGANHANGFSPGSSNSETIEPAALRTGPT